jgi:carbonic anhydrase/acetyltransferase-like protein (isoleucine patch superfamily)
MFTNIQDETVITDAESPLDEIHDGSTIVGNYVTIGKTLLLNLLSIQFFQNLIGHRCILKGCTVEDECLVGMGSVLEEGSYMETRSMLAAGSVLTKGSRIPSGELWRGIPAKYYRHLRDEEIEGFQLGAEHYYFLAERYFEDQWKPEWHPGYREVEKIMERKKQKETQKE